MTSNNPEHPRVNVSYAEDGGKTLHKSTSTKRTTGHDTVLRALQNKGKNVTITYVGGDSFSEGVIVAFDPYTVTIRKLGGARMVVFKHDIRSFSSPEDLPGVAS